jgi:hypothetical protein
MKLTFCPYEKEVRELMARGQWPPAWFAACPPELLAHVSDCRSCGDLVLISKAFQQARVETLAAARPVSPAVLLWRAQLRRRNAAVERVSLPFLSAQIFACAVALIAAVGFAGFESRSGVQWLTLSYWHDWFVQLPQAAAAQWDSLSFASQAGSGLTWIVLIPAVATLVLLGGVAVYLATDKS